MRAPAERLCWQRDHIERGEHWVFQVEHDGEYGPPEGARVRLHCVCGDRTDWHPGTSWQADRNPVWAEFAAHRLAAIEVQGVLW